MLRAMEPESFADGRYRVRNRLGQGGQKVVYTVHDRVLDRDCALAVIGSSAFGEQEIARFTQEAQLLARIGAHPHVVTVFDLGEEQRRPFIVSELIAGGDLASELS